MKTKILQDHSLLLTETRALWELECKRCLREWGVMCGCVMAQ